MTQMLEREVKSGTHGDLLTRDFLRELYITKRMTLKEIAKFVGVSRYAVYYYLKKHGIKTRDRRHREESELHAEQHWAWKGGKKKNRLGYVCVYQHSDGHYELEHRLIMSRHIGRPLANNEYVHHKNGKKDDNRIENLEILTPSKHSSYHAANYPEEAKKKISEANKKAWQRRKQALQKRGG